MELLISNGCAILVLQQPVCAALIELQRQDLMPHESEVATMEVYWTIMKSIADTTNVIGRKSTFPFQQLDH